MTVANTLQEARDLTLVNVWEKFLAPSLLKTSIDTWRNGLNDVLDSNNAEQKEALAWTIPTQFVNQNLPSVVGDQIESDLPPVIEVLSRTIERLQNVDSLTAQQTTDILAAYNAAWA